VIRTKNQNYLASGSDVGCCKVIIWDPVNWQPRHVFNSHQAAVTSILDLKDDTHILSTGYDGKLNIYNL
jgi:WD40 repeat protein